MKITIEHLDSSWSIDHDYCEDCDIQALAKFLCAVDASDSFDDKSLSAAMLCGVGYYLTQSHMEYSDRVFGDLCKAYTNAHFCAPSKYNGEALEEAIRNFIAYHTDSVEDDT